MYVVFQSRAVIGNMLSDADAVNNAFADAIAVGRDLGIENNFISQRANWRVASAEPNSKTLEWFATEAADYHIGVDEHRAEAAALAGRFDEARHWLAEEIRHAEALGGPFGLGGVLGFAGVRVETLAGDYEKAIELGEKGTALLIDGGQPSVGSTAAALLAQAYFAAGNHQKALEWAERGLELTAADDILTQILVRQVRGLVSASRGDASTAEREFDEAASMATSSHNPMLIGGVHFDRGWAFQLLGDRINAENEYRQALAFFEAKEAIPLAQRTRDRLAELGR
jgi:tetratricopeptide (TPR) repeat protein